jgi:hypothetical protein
MIAARAESTSTPTTDAREPHDHHDTEDLADAAGAALLYAEQNDQDEDRDGMMYGSKTFVATERPRRH